MSLENEDVWASLGAARIALAESNRRLATTMLDTCWLCGKSNWQGKCEFGGCRVWQLDNPKLHTHFVQRIINVFKTLRSCHKLAHR